MEQKLLIKCWWNWHLATSRMDIFFTLSVLFIKGRKVFQTPSSSTPLNSVACCSPSRQFSAFLSTFSSLFNDSWDSLARSSVACTREYLRGKYHCTIDLLFDWFGLVCFANKNKNCQLSYSWFQTSQTGGQRYSDTSPFSIPCLYYRAVIECDRLKKRKLKTASGKGTYFIRPRTMNSFNLILALICLAF